MWNSDKNHHLYSAQSCSESPRKLKESITDWVICKENKFISLFLEAGKPNIKVLLSGAFLPHCSKMGAHQLRSLSTSYKVISGPHLLDLPKAPLTNTSNI
jgi:hypothetical protein